MQFEEEEVEAAVENKQEREQVVDNYKRILSGQIEARDAVADLLPQGLPRERALHVTALRNALREAGKFEPGSGAAQ